MDCVAQQGCLGPGLCYGFHGHSMLSVGLQVMGVALMVGGGKCLVAVSRRDGRNVGWSRRNWRAACGETYETRDFRSKVEPVGRYISESLLHACHEPSIRMSAKSERIISFMRVPEKLLTAVNMSSGELPPVLFKRLHIRACLLCFVT